MKKNYNCFHTRQKITTLKEKIFSLTTTYISAIDNKEIFVGQKPSIDGYFFISDLALKFDRLTGKNTFDIFFYDVDEKYNIHSSEGRRQMYFDFSDFVRNYKNI